MKRTLTLLLLLALSLASSAQVNWRIKVQTLITDSLKGDTVVVDAPVKLLNVPEYADEDTILVKRQGMVGYASMQSVTDTLINIDSIQVHVITVDSILRVDSIYAYSIRVDSVIHVDSIYAYFIQVDSVINVDSIYAHFITVDSIVSLYYFYSFIVETDSIYSHIITVDSIIRVDSIYSFHVVTDSITTTIIHVDTIHLGTDTIVSLEQMADSFYVDYCDGCAQVDQVVYAGGTIAIDTSGQDVELSPWARSGTDIVPRTDDDDVLLTGISERLKFTNGSGTTTMYQNTNQFQLQQTHASQLPEINFQCIDATTQQENVYWQSSGSGHTFSSSRTGAPKYLQYTWGKHLVSGTTTAMPNGVEFAQINFGSSNGASLKPSVQFAMAATETWSGSSWGSQFKIQTVATGATGFTERFRIQGTGKIRFNNAYEFPSTAGSAGQVLVTDGSGNLSWGGSAAITGPMSVTAGENVSAGNLLVIKDSDGKWYKADANDTLLSVTLCGFATAAALADEPVNVTVVGIYTTTGLDAGKNYYISETAGAATATRPTSSGAVVRLIGTAISTTQLYLVPTLNHVILQ